MPRVCLPRFVHVPFDGMPITLPYDLLDDVDGLAIEVLSS